MHSNGGRLWSRRSDLSARVIVVLALIAVALGGTPSAVAAQNPPNVIVVLIDDARTDELSTMPIVRSLIGDAGATFPRSYAPFPLCCPGRATLLTGQYAHNHGVLNNAPPLGGVTAFDDSSTLATWLDDTHTTGFVGKYLNQYGRDVDLSYVPPGWDVWKATAPPIDYRQSRFSINGAVRHFPDQYRTDLVADLSISFIANAAAASETPFFLFTSFDAPHSGTPFESDDPTLVYDTDLYPTPNVADEYQNAFDGMPLDVGPAFNEEDISDKPRQPALLEQWEIDALTEVSQQRRESLLSVDDAVQRMITALEATNQLDNTYVIFTSDNGYLLGEHRLRSGKNVPYEPSVNVPLLIRGPGIVPGTVVPQLVGAHDIAPTVLSMTGRTGAQGDFVIDGVDLLPIIADPREHARRPIVLEVGPSNVDPTGAYRFHGIRSQQWKFIERNTGKLELYDMVNDPFELENLAREPAYQRFIPTFRQALYHYRFCVGAGCH